MPLQATMELRSGGKACGLREGRGCLRGLMMAARSGQLMCLQLVEALPQPLGEAQAEVVLVLRRQAHLLLVLVVPRPLAAAAA